MFSLLPASGWIGDRFGGRNVLLASIAVFTAASALCGLAASLPELVTSAPCRASGAVSSSPSA